MDYSIRNLALNELPEIVMIVKRSIKEDFPMYNQKTQIAYTKLFGRKFFRKLITAKGSTVLGAFVEKKLAGVLGIKGDFGGVAFIEWFIVKKEFRNQGIGIALLKVAEDWSLKNKYHYLYFYTESNKNIEFYKKRGYQYIGNFRNSWFGANEHAMQKVLREKPFEEVFEKYLKKGKVKHY